MKVSVYLAKSVNGVTSNSRNVPDWLSPEHEAGFASICQRTKAVIMGRTTYNILAPDYLPLKDEGTLVVLAHDTGTKPAQANVLFTGGCRLRRRRRQPHERAGAGERRRRLNRPAPVEIAVLHSSHG